jgi:hypothetical protein
VRAQARQAGGDLLPAAPRAARPDRVRRDLIDRDYEIIRPDCRPARPHRHAAQAAAARLAHRYVPDLGQAQLPAGQHLEPALAVNRMVCRRS